MNALGLDISRYNGRGNWEAIKKVGVNFVIIKAGGIYSNSGICYTDDLLTDHVNGAKSVGIPFGLYWYFLPFPKYSEQIECYKNLIKVHRPTINCAFIDAESNNGKSATQVTDALKHFLPAFDGFTDMTIIYTRQSWWDLNVKVDPSWSRYWLWVSRWASHLTGPWSDQKYKFRDWKSWLFWQFSGDNNNLGKKFGFPGPPPSNYTGDRYNYGDPDIDLNYFNGNLDTFNIWRGYKEEKLPPKTIDEILIDHERRLKMLEDTFRK